MSKYKNNFNRIFSATNRSRVERRVKGFRSDRFIKEFEKEMKQAIKDGDYDRVEELKRLLLELKKDRQ